MMFFFFFPDTLHSAQTFYRVQFTASPFAMRKLFAFVVLISFQSQPKHTSVLSFSFRHSCNRSRFRTNLLLCDMKIYVFNGLPFYIVKPPPIPFQINFSTPRKFVFSFSSNFITTARIVSIFCISTTPANLNSGGKIKFMHTFCSLRHETRCHKNAKCQWWWLNSFEHLKFDFRTYFNWQHFLFRGLANYWMRVGCCNELSDSVYQTSMNYINWIRNSACCSFGWTVSLGAHSVAFDDLDSVRWGNNYFMKWLKLTFR